MSKKNTLVAEPEVAAGPKVEAVETKSSKMVKMWKEGTPIATIASTLGVRYEFPYQVCQRFAKKHNLPFVTNREKGVSKADVIRELHATGLKAKEIAKDPRLAGTYYAYIWQTVKNIEQAAV